MRPEIVERNKLIENRRQAIHNYYEFMEQLDKKTGIVGLGSLIATMVGNMYNINDCNRKIAEIDEAIKTKKVV